VGLSKEGDDDDEGAEEEEEGQSGLDPDDLHK
jgi:hypothetical protein